MTAGLSRRQFLKVGCAVAGGLLVGFRLPGLPGFAAQGPKRFEPNAFLRIGTDGAVVVIVPKSEMGQGVLTALPMIVAEELDADWSRVRYEQAPAAPAYRGRAGLQVTGASSSVRGNWQTLREAGATARAYLLAAAAGSWSVAPDTCRTESGQVVHDPSGRRLDYGDLAEAAAGLASARQTGAPGPTGGLLAAAPGAARALRIPPQVRLKDAREFRIVGKSIARLDTPPKVDGSAEFGIDVRLPDMLVARVVRPPVFGGKVAGFDAARAKAVPGVRHVLAIASGVAVVADSFWAAKQGSDVLAVRWDDGPNGGLTSAEISRRYAQAAEFPGDPARSEGAPAEHLAGAAVKLQAVYETPYLAHATMEPMNATAHVRPHGVEIWAPTQAQSLAQNAGARITGRPLDDIVVHTTLLGGGFGRRAEPDFVADAVELSKALGRPVKVVWTREDDMQHDYYRPATHHRLEAGLDAAGNLVAWRHRIVGPSIMARWAPELVRLGSDPTVSEGALHLPYAVPHVAVETRLVDAGIPVGFWRSVGYSYNSYVTECFFDEACRRAGGDPVAARLALLGGHPRHRGALELAARKAGWGDPLAKGRYRGAAVAESFGSYVAQVAEVSIAAGQVRVHRVVCAIDCGTVVNPGIVAAQMEGGIVYGLSAALGGEITIARGRAAQSNFHDYPVLRFDEMPRVDVHIVPSAEPPGGVGEPGVPPIAPAVCNAILAATGKPVRKLPIRLG